MIFVSPHPDDEVLFGAYTIMREKPLVVIVTHPTEQGNNAHIRLMESYEALRLLGVPVCFLGIPENELTEKTLTEALERFRGIKAYVPYKDGGNPHHDLVHGVCSKMFDCTYYRTYGLGETRAIGAEVIPTEEERQLKQKAMNCYQSQINNMNTAHYFNEDKEYV